ncbi:MAG TPA: RND transporter [Parachlamydiales bacterium]|nr:RND transporter [Parachlamydiales bacterium]
MKKIWAFLFLSSCTLYPRYERPCLESFDDWRTPLPTQNAVEIAWWKQFNDPVLNDLITKALTSNQDILTAIARVDQFRAQWKIASSLLYPQLQAGGVGNRQKVSNAMLTPTAVPNPIFNTFGALLQASYFVDLWAEIRSGAEAAYHQWLASIDARQTVVLAIVSSVATTYVQLRQFDEQLIVSKDTLKTRQEAYYLAKVRHELGLTSLLEVEQAIAEAEIAKVQVERFEIAIAEAENLLSVLLGQASQDIPRGLGINQLPMPPSVPDCTPAYIVCQRPDVQAAEEQLKAANAQIGVAWAQFFPQINLLGIVGTQSSWLSPLLSGPSNLFQYGTNIIQEIFTGGRLTGQVELAYAVKCELLHNYLQTVLKAFQEVNNALTSHKYYLEMVETQRLRMEADKNYLHLSDLRYQEGEIDYLTFLDAERQYFQAQLDYEETKGNSFVSFIQIYQALGGPWVIEADKEVLEYKETCAKPFQ